MKKLWLTVFATLITLDLLWFKLVSGNFFLQNMRPLARTNARGDAFAPDYPAAVMVYILLTCGIMFFVQPHKTATPLTALGRGALFGAICYGIYDFTNRATLMHWPYQLMAVDIAWGAVSCALTSAVINFLTKKVQLEH